MKKRVISLLLSLLLLLSLIASAVLPVFAAADMAASEDCVAVLKKMEGFSKYPMDDYGQYSVGYGTACSEDDLERYRSRGITEEEADTLLRSCLETIAVSVNKFAASNNLSLSQSQFDALLMFTYNVGSAWLSGTSDLKNAVLTGATGNDLIYYMSRWCTADYQVIPGLVKRRLAEADLFLNGNYSDEAPSYYSYVSFDANGGACTSRVQGYDASDPAAIRAEPTRSGYRFQGWYTATEGGQWITDLDTTTAEVTLYARWQMDDGNVVDGVIQGTACEYKRKTNSAATLSVYESPNAAKPFAHLNAGITVKIIADYVDSAGAKWGKMEGGGWINLGTTHQVVYPAAKTVRTNVSVTVTNSFINVRSGAGTTYSAVGKVYKGDTLVISETQMVGQVKWGRYSGGWICLSYTDFNSSAGNSSENSSSTGLTGTVVNCTSLRVRSGPGTGYVSVGEVKAGETVTISQTKTVGAAVWGKISNGWICLSYVKLNESASSASPSEDTSTENGDGRCGTVINCTTLNVRSAAGTSSKLVDTISAGTRVVIYEMTTVKGVQWARIKQGWISMSYIQMDYSGSAEGQTGTVVSDTNLNVRSGAGTACSRVTTLASGSTVTVYETTMVNGVSWGRIDQGWVCMTYVKLGTDSTGTNTETILGTVYGANSLRIRKGAGTIYAQAGSLSKGTQVEIYETTMVNGVQWGRISQGWVCMSYIQTGDGILFTGTVNTESLRIRSGAGTANSVVGSYNYGTQVEILETTKVNGVTWGRTNQGWISLNYVKY